MPGVDEPGDGHRPADPEIAQAFHGSALRYYEEQGLRTFERSPAGQREYHEEAVDRVRFFQQLYGAGLSSRRVAELLPCINAGTTTEAQRAARRAHRRRADNSVA
jgi:DNA-binding transcriptional MerR regulator